MKVTERESVALIICLIYLFFLMMILLENNGVQVLFYKILQICAILKKPDNMLSSGVIVIHNDDNFDYQFHMFLTVLSIICVLLIPAATLLFSLQWGKKKYCTMAKEIARRKVVQKNKNRIESQHCQTTNAEQRKGVTICRLA